MYMTLLLEGLGSAFDHSLGLSQAQAGDLTDDLDDLDLGSGIKAGQDHVELGLLLSGGSGTGGGTSGHGGGGNAEFLLQSVNDLAQLQDGQGLDLFNQSSYFLASHY